MPNYWAGRRLDKLACTVAHYLPRRIALWAFVRVTVEGCEDNPVDQSLMAVMERWEAKSDAR